MSAMNPDDDYPGGMHQPVELSEDGLPIDVFEAEKTLKAAAAEALANSTDAELVKLAEGTSKKKPSTSEVDRLRAVMMHTVRDHVLKILQDRHDMPLDDIVDEVMVEVTGWMVDRLRNLDIEFSLYDQNYVLALLMGVDKYELQL